jgi:hypothetical protein
VVIQDAMFTIQSIGLGVISTFSSIRPIFIVAFPERTARPAESNLLKCRGNAAARYFGRKTALFRGEQKKSQSHCLS